MENSPAREARIPAIHYPGDLPITACRAQIAQAIDRHQVIIVAGETGSGKTTQLPKICLEMRRGRGPLIGHTQPRRLAARTVAARIASELGSVAGDLVGYQVRFNDRMSDNTAIKLMTDGILLAELQRDRLLRRYDTLIIDEAHERSLNIDFLLGYLKRLLPRRPDLKLIVTSATIDVDSFSRHFDGAPVIEIPGRTFPVTTHYLPHDGDGARDLEQQVAALVGAIDAGQFGPRGDILVFLPGEREIRELAGTLRRDTDVEVLPLYARLGQAEQNRVFDSGRRGAPIRAVLATNVAETSLTVPGIRYVIDPGEARIGRYSHRTQLQRLPVEPISRASADQRRGRCGRVGSGVCLRLYAESDYDARPAFTDPEIQRSNLAAVILQMQVLGLGDVQQFPFIDPPDARTVRDGFRLLKELGAIGRKGELTGLGRRMARLPVDPRLARMVLAAAERDCLEEILVIASALAVQDPRERPAEKQQQAEQMHARFRHPRSDFMAWLNLWRHYEEQRQMLSQNQLRKLCQREFLSFLRMREWRDVHTQLRIACRELGLKSRAGPAGDEQYEAVHTTLLSGLLGNIARHDEGRDYTGSRNRTLRIHPGSAQTRKSPKWLVAAEIVETTGVYAREVAAIDPAWALSINPDLLKYQHYQPRWHARRGQVVAYERVTLYGLTLADRREVHYGPIAPVESRELLIREGLIPGNFRQPPAFLRHNAQLVKDLENIESRTRRRDILVEEQVQFDFYDERLPEEICTASGLRSWLARHPEEERGLYMTCETLTARDPGAAVGEQFPDHLDFEDMRFRLSYRFEPGHATDGVSVTVPVALLNRAPRFLFDWLVPGLLREKCVQLVKGLPKEKRKRLVPAPDYVDRALARLPAGDTDLLSCLAQQLSALGGAHLERTDWVLHKLDDYYRMNIRVVDAEGRLLAQGRDLPELVQRFRADTRASISAGTGDTPVRQGIVRWDLGELPREWRLRQAGVEIVAYPALVDRGSSVAIELCDYPGVARVQHRLGVLRLLRLAGAQQGKYLRKRVLRGNETSLALAACGLDAGALVEDLIDAAYVQSAGLEESLPRTGQEFTQLERRSRGAVIGRAGELQATLLATLETLPQVHRQLGALDGDRWQDARADITEQLSSLFAPSFLRDTPAEWLAQYPRYVRAIALRLERFAGQVPKDQKYAGMLGELALPLKFALGDRPSLLLQCPEARDYRWMLEEFRVSLFAQQLGTRRPVSQRRLAEQWRAVERWQAENPR